MGSGLHPCSPESPSVLDCTRGVEGRSPCAGCVVAISCSANVPKHSPPASPQLLWEASSAPLKWLLVIGPGQRVKLGPSRGAHGL